MTVPNRPVSGAPIETAWGDVVHDGYVAQDLQVGAVEVPMPVTSDGSVPVTFPRPFAAPPIVLCVNNGTNNGVNTGTIFVVAALAITATSFSARVSHTSGQTAAASCSVRWIAYGPRA